MKSLSLRGCCISPARAAGLLLAPTAFLSGVSSAQAQPDYAPAHWVPPASCNKYYTSGNGHSLIVIHDMEGYYQSSVSYLNRCDLNTNGNYNVSASVQYLVNGLKHGNDEDGHTGDDNPDAPGGDVTQSVRDANYAWHAVCLNTWSTGTEHEGFVSSPAWYTETMYVASAALQRYVANKFHVLRDRNHIVGHGEWQNATWVSWMSTNYPSINPMCNTHTDPGIYWNWSHFMNLITGVPAIVADPWSQVVQTGSNATFTVTAASTNALKYQWRKNGAFIAGATNSAYSLANVQSADAAGYSVSASNSLGMVTSRVATLTVAPVWVLAFADDFETNSAARWNMFWGAANGIADYTTNWAFDYSAQAYTTNDVTNFIPSAPNSGGSTRGLKVTVNKNDATASVVGLSFYPKNFTFSNNYCLKFDAWINYPGVSGGGTGSTEYQTCGINHTGTRVNWSTTGTSSDGLWFAMDGEGGSGGSDYRAYQGNGAAAPTQLTFANSGLGASGATRDHYSDTPWQTMFPYPAYETQGAPGKRWVQVELSQIGSLITWQVNGIVMAQRTNTSAYTSGNVMIGYFDGFNSIASPAADSFAIFDNVRVYTGAVAPVITNQPISLTVTQGVSAAFSVKAGGTSPLTYQWRLNGTNIGGATASSYTRIAATTNDAGNYSVGITNAGGGLLSSNALLTVLVPPGITLQPLGRVVKVGSNVTFTVNATGTAPLGYQWKFNTGDLPGATNSTYTRVNAQTNDSGNYSVVITNLAGTAISSNAVLTVNPLVPPQFNSVVKLAGGQIQMSVSGDPGNYSVLWGSNFVDWQLLTNLVIGGSPVQFTDATTNQPQRFYKVMTSP